MSEKQGQAQSLETPGNGAPDEGGSTLAVGSRAAGTETGPALDGGGAGEQAAPTAPEGGTGTDAPWYAGLPEEHHQALAGFGDKDQALLGLLGKTGETPAGLLKVPGPDATDEERAAFRKALGVPDAAEGYALPEGLKPPEGVDLNDDVGQDFRRAAHELGLSDAQFQGVLQWAVPLAAQGDAAAARAAQEFQRGEVAALRQEHGAGTAKLLDDAKTAAMALGGDELIQALGDAGSDRRVLAAFARLAPLVTEGRLTGPSGATSQSGPVTRASIEAMMDDPRYRDPDKRDEAYVAQVREACKRLERK